MAKDKRTSGESKVMIGYERLISLAASLHLINPCMEMMIKPTAACLRSGLSFVNVETRALCLPGLELMVEESRELMKTMNHMTDHLI